MANRQPEIRTNLILANGVEQTFAFFHALHKSLCSFVRVALVHAVYLFLLGFGLLGFAPSAGAQAYPATLANTATVIVPAGTTDPVPGNNSATDTNNLSAIADVTATVTAPASATAGATTSASFSYSNGGPSSAAGVTYTASLPAGLTGVSFPTVPAGVTASYNSGTGAITFTGMPATLSSGQSLNFSVQYTAPAAGSVALATSLATTTGQGANAAPDSASGTTTINASADVVSSKTGPATVNAGGNLTYTITVLNNGPSAAANVAVTDNLPAGVTFVSATGSGSYNAGPNSVTWPLIASLANGASQSYSVVVTAPASGGPLLNRVSSTSATSDPTPANNDGSAAAAQVSTSITPIADVTATVTAPASA
ncbi:MAG: hypothetical protein WCB36_03880, partial [Burkholderiales bacterium]